MEKNRKCLEKPFNSVKKYFENSLNHNCCLSRNYVIIDNISIFEQLNIQVLKKGKNIYIKFVAFLEEFNISHHIIDTKL